MSYNLFVQPRAQAALDKVPPDFFPRIDSAIKSLQENPRPYGVKKLEGDLHRIRVGDWRVIYGIFDSEQRVIIFHVARRSEKTYRRFRNWE